MASPLPSAHTVPLVRCAIAMVLAGGCTGGDDALAGDSTSAGAPSTTAAVPDTEGDSDASTSGGEPDAPACEADAGPAVVRRLTRFEYDNTVRDLLGTTLQPAQTFAAEPLWLGFDNNGSVSSVSDRIAEQYMTAAEALATDAIARLDTIVPCDPLAVGEAECARQFVVDFTRRAYRRPAPAAHVDALFALWQSGRDTGDFASGIGRVIEAVLQSPRFLYRFEGADAEPDARGVIALDDHEIGARLSYFLWGSMPDDALLAAADAGELQDPEIRAEHARRLLEDPRARTAVVHFWEQVLQLGALEIAERDASVFEDWNADIKARMAAEARGFVAHAVFETDGRLETLLTTPHSWLDATLASYYGLVVAAGDTPAWVQLPADTHRFGLLTQGGIMAGLGKYTTTAPVLRGKFVREQLLCETLPPPPDDVDFEPPQIDEDATARERYAEHSTNPQCSGCHQMMDPIGFGFENYDGAGRWRALENGAPIDARGVVVSAEGEIEFDGVPALVDVLFEGGRLHDCIALQSMRYALGREESTEDDCAIEDLRVRFREHGDLRELLVDLTRSEAFVTVRPAEVP